MAVLPRESSALLPAAYRHLMLDSNSPIIDFYPAEFNTDMTDKKNPWEAIVLIPFIDQDRLVRAMEQVDIKLLSADVQETTVFFLTLLGTESQ